MKKSSISGYEGEEVQITAHIKETIDLVKIKFGKLFEHFSLSFWKILLNNVENSQNTRKIGNLEK